MKPFNEQNYYEILDISPNAISFDIRHAYKAALEIYQDDSLVSYSFFSEDERNAILARLEKAFVTLINDETRHEYDQTLINLGLLDKESRHKHQKEPVPIIDFRHSQTPAKTRFTTLRNMKSHLDTNHVLKQILANNVFTGMDLKRMRIEFGIPLEYIAEETKIQIGLLRSIEDDRFDQLPSRFHLKSFLKSYVQCFPIHAESVVNRYMKRIKD